MAHHRKSGSAERTSRESTSIARPLVLPRLLPRSRTWAVNRTGHVQLDISNSYENSGGTLEQMSYFRSCSIVNRSSTPAQIRQMQCVSGRGGGSHAGHRHVSTWSQKTTKAVDDTHQVRYCSTLKTRSRCHLASCTPTLDWCLCGYGEPSGETAVA